MNKKARTKRYTRISIIFAISLAMLFTAVPGVDNVAFAATGDQKAKAENPKAKVNYIRKNGRILDIRAKAGNRLRGYTILQGVCSDGKYLYMAFEKRNGDADGKKRARIKIAKVRIKGWKVVKVSRSGQKLGHANDITYNRHKKYLVVTGAKTNDPYVRLVSPKTLKKIGTKKVRLPRKHSYARAFNAIDYDSKSRTYFIRGRETDGMSFVIDQNFKYKGAANIKSTWTDRHVQSSASTGDYFIVPQSLNQSKDKNTITFFRKTGGAESNIKIPVNGELQAVFYVGNRMYGAVYKKGNNKRKAHLIRIRFK